MKFIFYIISFCVISSDYFRFAFSFPYMDRFALLCSFSFFIYRIVKNKRINVSVKGYGWIIFIYFLVCFFVSINGESSVASFCYELVKLLGFLFFIPFLSVLTNKEIKLLISVFLRVFFYFSVLNFLIMLSQMVFGDHVVGYLFMPTDMYDNSQKANRAMGLYGNLPALSLSALCCYIFIDNYSAKVFFINKLKIVLFLTVMLSTSKIAMIIFVVYESIKRLNKNILVKIIPVIICMCCFVYLLSFNQLFQDKLTQIELLYNMKDYISSISSSDVDLRFYCYTLAYIIFSNHPFGLGLGTWGDYSSRLNNDLEHGYQQIYMTDSAFTHIIVEQGIFILLYFFIIWYPIFQNRKSKIKYFAILATISFFTTMGFSDTTWPSIFSFFFATSLYMDKIKNDKCYYSGFQ